MTPANRTLIIYNSINYFVPYFEAKGFTVSKVFKDIPFLLKFFRKGMFLFKLPFRKIWLRKWQAQLKSDKFDQVIFFSTNPIDGLIYLLPYFSPNKIIYWYWDPLKIGIKPSALEKYKCKLWTFDKQDADQYKINYNTTFYFDNIVLPENTVAFDVLFIGLEKGRRGLINQVGNILERNGLRPYFYIVDNDAWKPNYKGAFPKVDYSQYLEKVSQSKAILDIVQENQWGLTLRPMESIFFEKKLITNNRQISEHDFYDPQNIFIIGKDNWDDLTNFVNSPYRKTDPAVKKKYDITEWANRFS